MGIELILGAVVSLVAQFTKDLVSKNEWARLGLVVALALLAALAYSTLQATGYWESATAILVSAGAFYTFIVERFK